MTPSHSPPRGRFDQLLPPWGKEGLGVSFCIFHNLFLENFELKYLAAKLKISIKIVSISAEA